MSAHLEEQLAFFSGVDYAQRFRWQTEDEFVRTHEHEAIRPFVDALLLLARDRPLRILESGCGEGVNLMHLKQLGVVSGVADVVGIDPCREAVQEAQRHGFDVREGNGLALPFPDQSFDVVFCRDVLHHLENDDARRAFYLEMRRVCRPAGLVAAIEPNPWNPMIFALAAFVAAERGLLSIAETRIAHLLPGATVVPTVPSAAWRMWFHYRSPFRLPVFSSIVRAALFVWEECCRKIFPTRFWSYRVYLWK